MNAEMSGRVRPILQRGLDVYASSSDPAPDLNEIQAEFTRLLRQFQTFERALPREEGPAPLSEEVAPSATYALTCWLDELLDSTAPNWMGVALEAELFGSRQRAWRFWMQAECARDAAGNSPLARDVLEVYTLCVQLGFLGERRVREDRMKWVREARAVLASGRQSRPRQPDVRSDSDAVPLRGRRRLAGVAVAGGILFLLLAGVVAYALWLRSQS